MEHSGFITAYIYSGCLPPSSESALQQTIWNAKLQVLGESQSALKELDMNIYPRGRLGSITPCPYFMFLISCCCFLHISHSVFIMTDHIRFYVWLFIFWKFLPSLTSLALFELTKTNQSILLRRRVISHLGMAENK